MIKNWEHFNLHPDFKNIKCPVGKPSDIDMFYITKDKFLILGEFKNADMGNLGFTQREMFETFINNYKNGGIIIYATHHCLVENGDKEYDASKCQIEKYYLKGKWHKPKKYTIVQDVIDQYCKEENMNISEERTKTIFKNEKNGKIYYSLGLSKKDIDGNYINGYINCKFPKSATIEDKTKIKIHEAWLDFYVKDKKTFPYVFINKYEIIEEIQDNTQKNIQEVNEFSNMNIKTEYVTNDSSVNIDNSDLPF